MSLVLLVQGLAVLLTFLSIVEGNGNGFALGVGNSHKSGNDNSNNQGPWDEDGDLSTACGCWDGCGMPEESDSVDVFLSSTSVGSIATYVCKDGYGDLSGSKIIECHGNGTWSGSAPSCSFNGCGIPDIGSGTVADFPGTGPGDVATYTCAGGYSGLTGSTERVCQNDGTWSDMAPICTVQACNAPEVEDGTVVTAAGTNLGDIASYSCAEGYKDLSGNRERACEFDGTWTGSAPTCTKNECEEPYPGLNTVVEFTGLTVGSVATYSCINDDMTLIYDEQITCTPDLVWNPWPAICANLEDFIIP